MDGYMKVHFGIPKPQRHLKWQRAMTPVTRISASNTDSQVIRSGSAMDIIAVPTVSGGGPQRGVTTPVVVGLSNSDTNPTGATPSVFASSAVSSLKHFSPVAMRQGPPPPVDTFTIAAATTGTAADDGSRGIVRRRVSAFPSVGFPRPLSRSGALGIHQLQQQQQPQQQQQQQLPTLHVSMMSVSAATEGTREASPAGGGGSSIPSQQSTTHHHRQSSNASPVINSPQSCSTVCLTPPMSIGRSALRAAAAAAAATTAAVALSGPLSAASSPVKKTVGGVGGRHHLPMGQQQGQREIAMDEETLVATQQKKHHMLGSSNANTTPAPSNLPRDHHSSRSPSPPTPLPRPVSPARLPTGGACGSIITSPAYAVLDRWSSSNNAPTEAQATATPTPTSTAGFAELAWAVRCDQESRYAARPCSCCVGGNHGRHAKGSKQRDDETSGTVADGNSMRPSPSRGDGDPGGSPPSCPRMPSLVRAVGYIAGSWLARADDAADDAAPDSRGRHTDHGRLHRPPAAPQSALRGGGSSSNGRAPDKQRPPTSPRSEPGGQTPQRSRAKTVIVVETGDEVPKPSAAVGRSPSPTRRRVGTSTALSGSGELDNSIAMPVALTAAVAPSLPSLEATARSVVGRLAVVASSSSAAPLAAANAESDDVTLHQVPPLGSMRRPTSGAGVGPNEEDGCMTTRTDLSATSAPFKLWRPPSGFGGGTLPSSRHSGAGVFGWPSAGSVSPPLSRSFSISAGATPALGPANPVSMPPGAGLATTIVDGDTTYRRDIEWHKARHVPQLAPFRQDLNMFGTNEGGAAAVSGTDGATLAARPATRAAPTSLADLDDDQFLATRTLRPRPTGAPFFASALMPSAVKHTRRAAAMAHGAGAGGDRGRVGTVHSAVKSGAESGNDNLHAQTPTTPNDGDDVFTGFGLNPDGHGKPKRQKVRRVGGRVVTNERAVHLLHHLDEARKAARELDETNSAQHAKFFPDLQHRHQPHLMSAGAADAAAGGSPGGGGSGDIEAETGGTLATGLAATPSAARAALGTTDSVEGDDGADALGFTRSGSLRTSVTVTHSSMHLNGAAAGGGGGGSSTSPFSGWATMRSTAAHAGVVVPQGPQTDSVDSPSTPSQAHRIQHASATGEAVDEDDHDESRRKEQRAGEARRIVAESVRANGLVERHQPVPTLYTTAMAGARKAVEHKAAIRALFRRAVRHVLTGVRANRVRLAFAPSGGAAPSATVVAKRRAFDAREHAREQALISARRQAGIDLVWLLVGAVMGVLPSPAAAATPAVSGNADAATGGNRDQQHLRAGSLSGGGAGNLRSTGPAVRTVASSSASPFLASKLRPVAALFDDAIAFQQQQVLAAQRFQRSLQLQQLQQGPRLSGVALLNQSLNLVSPRSTNSNGIESVGSARTDGMHRRATTVLFSTSAVDAAPPASNARSGAPPLAPRASVSGGDGTSTGGILPGVTTPAITPSSRASPLGALANRRPTSVASTKMGGPFPSRGYPAGRSVSPVMGAALPSAARANVLACVPTANAVETGRRLAAGKLDTEVYREFRALVHTLVHGFPPVTAISLDDAPMSPLSATGGLLGGSTNAAAGAGAVSGLELPVSELHALLVVHTSVAGSPLEGSPVGSPLALKRASHSLGSATISNHQGRKSLAPLAAAASREVSASGGGSGAPIAPALPTHEGELLMVAIRTLMDNYATVQCGGNASPDTLTLEAAIRIAIPAMSGEDVKRQGNRVDAADAKARAIAVAELRDKQYALGVLRKATPEQRETVARMFAALDTTGKGYLTRAEVEAWIRDPAIRDYIGVDDWFRPKHAAGAVQSPGRHHHPLGMATPLQVPSVAPSVQLPNAATPLAVAQPSGFAPSSPIQATSSAAVNRLRVGGPPPVAAMSLQSVCSPQMSGMTTVAAGGEYAHDTPPTEFLLGGGAVSPGSQPPQQVVVGADEKFTLERFAEAIQCSFLRDDEILLHSMGSLIIPPTGVPPLPPIFTTTWSTPWQGQATAPPP